MYSPQNAKPAHGGLREKRQIFSQDNVAQENIEVNLPDWMVEKLAKIASKIDVWQFELEETIILAAQIRCFPEQANILPASFRKKIDKISPRDLSPFERAAIIITAYDWLHIPDYCTESHDEQIRVIFSTLASCLREGAIRE
jgi:hypothetical protein